MEVKVTGSFESSIALHPSSVPPERGRPRPAWSRRRGGIRGSPRPSPTVECVRRLFGIVFALVCAAAATALTWPTLFGLERTFPLAQIISFRVPVAAGFVAAAALALLFALIRPLRALALTLTVIFVAAAGVNGAMVLQRGTGTDGLPEKTDTSLRVMTWNTAGSATSAESIAQFAVGMKADVVTLPETTIETGTRVAELMRDMGQPMWAHHAEYGEYGITGWDATSTTVLIRPELGDYSVIESSLDGSSNTSTVPSAVRDAGVRERTDHRRGPRRRAASGVHDAVAVGSAVARRSVRDRQRHPRRGLQRHARPHDRAGGRGRHPGTLPRRRVRERQRRDRNLADGLPRGPGRPHRSRHGHPRLDRHRLRRDADARRLGQRPPAHRRQLERTAG